MTATIFKSQLGDVSPDAFGKMVEAHRHALMTHRNTVGAPAPTAANALVEMSVRRTRTPGKPDEFVLDYDIIDDTPPPPEPVSLADRKTALHRAVLDEETKLSAAIISPGKARYFTFRRRDISVKKEADYTAEDRKFIAEDGVRAQRLENLARHAAILLAEIDDLTDENIGKWQMRAFPR